METRKIQLAGGTTYTVSLPKEWASEHGLDAGTAVRVYPHGDGSLVVRTNGRRDPDPAPLTVTADALDPAALRRQIEAGYRAGRDAVALTSDDGFGADQRAAVDDAAQGLLGVDIVERSDARIVCKSLLDATDVSVEQSLHQLQYVACSAHSHAVAGLAGDRDDSRNVEDREAEATRLVALVARQFERALVDPTELDDVALELPTLFDYYAGARQLERVASHAATVAGLVRRHDDPVDDDVAATIEETATDACELVERATSALLDGVDADEACAVRADVDALTAAVHDRPSTDALPAELALVVHALDATADCGGAIADVALRAAVRAGDR